MGHTAPTPACLDAVAKNRSILVALRDRTDDREFVMNTEDRMKAICNNLHALMDTCPDLFDDVMIEWTKGLDAAIEAMSSGQSEPL